MVMVKYSKLPFSPLASTVPIKLRSNWADLLMPSRGIHSGKTDGPGQGHKWPTEGQTLGQACNDFNMRCGSVFSEHHCSYPLPQSGRGA